MVGMPVAGGKAVGASGPKGVPVAVANGLGVIKGPLNGPADGSNPARDVQLTTVTASPRRARYGDVRRLIEAGFYQSPSKDAPRPSKVPGQAHASEEVKAGQ